LALELAYVTDCRIEVSFQSQGIDVFISFLPSYFLFFSYFVVCSIVFYSCGLGELFGTHGLFGLKQNLAQQTVP
jgi:hypothetical protein